MERGVVSIPHPASPFAPFAMNHKIVRSSIPRSGHSACLGNNQINYHTPPLFVHSKPTTYANRGGEFHAKGLLISQPYCTKSSSKFFAFGETAMSISSLINGILRDSSFRTIDSFPEVTAASKQYVNSRASIPCCTRCSKTCKTDSSPVSHFSSASAIRLSGCRSFDNVPCGQSLMGVKIGKSSSMMFVVVVVHVHLWPESWLRRLNLYRWMKTVWLVGVDARLECLIRLSGPDQSHLLALIEIAEVLCDWGRLQFTASRQGSIAIDYTGTGGTAPQTSYY